MEHIVRLRHSRAEGAKKAQLLPLLGGFKGRGSRPHPEGLGFRV